MSKYRILRDDDVLTPEAVRAIIAKECLIKASGTFPSTGHLITAVNPRRYLVFAFEYNVTDSGDASDLDESAHLTMLASEAVLRREWDTPEEDEAWANLLRAK